MTSNEPSWGMSLAQGTAAGAANTILGQVGSMIFGGAQDRRQLRQQEKLNALQIKGNKEMIDYSNAAQEAMQMSMWDKTNYAAQIKQMEKAGLSPSMIYGGSGTGGATAGGGGGSGSVGGASAGDPNAAMGMGLQLASLLALQKAQKENIEADTENKKAGAGLAGAQTSTEKETAEIRGNERTISDRTMKEQETLVEQKALASQLENKLTELKTKGIKSENRQKAAEAIIKEFEANMTKNGMSTNTPWWIKFIADQAEKFGLGNLLK